ncbi:MAG TPA: hypothetical protein VKK19_13970 [Candidatus Dormibacteraeota bacterium]|nr:hypothetical protein [Candidatus Dormibacteraeota bacterium]
MRRLSREAVFGIVCAVLVAATVSYVGYVARHVSRPPAAAVAAGGDPQLLALMQQPHLVFLQPSGADPTQDVVSVAPLEQGTTARVQTGLHCQRTYFAAGHGICLGRDLVGSSFLFDDRFQVGRRFQQPGLSSRARISRDGRFAASTVFVTGHSYNSPGFSTQTLITDLASGAAVDLERFTVTQNGQRIQSPDFNFWGVTFAPDGDHFYATLGTGGHAYLVEGDQTTRTARVLADQVECPSLSPDGTRVAYKRPLPGDQRKWRLHVLDLRTMADTALAETRSVDDQVEWLDDSRIAYGLQDEGPPATLDVNLWTLPADGAGAPSLFLAHAASPAVFRG